MITDTQRREIKKRMRAIKDAADNDRPDKIIEERTKELTDYLQQEGIINPFRDDD